MGRSRLHYCSRNCFRTEKNSLYFHSRYWLYRACSQDIMRAKRISSFRGGLDNFMNNRLKNRCYEDSWCPKSTSCGCCGWRSVKFSRRQSGWYNLPVDSALMSLPETFSWVRQWMMVWFSKAFLRLSNVIKPSFSPI